MSRMSNFQLQMEEEDVEEVRHRRDRQGEQSVVDLSVDGPEEEEVEVELAALATLEGRESTRRQIRTRTLTRTRTRTRTQIRTLILDQELRGDFRGMREVRRIQEEMARDGHEHEYDLSRLLLCLPLLLLNLLVLFAFTKTMLYVYMLV